LCYGYRVVKKLDSEGEPVRGDREIVPEEATIVRRIFREFAAGKSPKAIAVDLNKEGVPGPLGRHWGDTSVRGHVIRGTGIINNELYTGVLVWNRLRFIKDPATGKRVSRANSPIKWIRTEVPHLRIVEEELWLAVKERQKSIASQFAAVATATRKARARKLHTMRRPVSLLSGLLTCGCCGGRYGLFTRDRYACLNHQRRGICDNGRTITREKIEERVLAGLRERLVSPDTVAEAIRAYAEETNRLNQERRAQGEQERKALNKIERAIAGIMAAIEDGLYQPSMKARMEDLERQKAEITARLEMTPTDLPDLHPNIATLYRKRVEQLTQALVDHEDGRPAADALRSLIGEIVLTPGDKRGEVHAELRGELFGILEFAKSDQNEKSDDVMTKGVAGPRNQIKRPAWLLASGPFALAANDGRNQFAPWI
ncbi:recombinase family protein, partial [Mesorhizobium sp. M4B.F.Ca.ET.013.02.1.1]